MEIGSLDVGLVGSLLNRGGVFAPDTFLNFQLSNNLDLVNLDNAKLEVLGSALGDFELCSDGRSVSKDSRIYTALHRPEKDLLDVFMLSLGLSFLTLDELCAFARPSSDLGELRTNVNKVLNR